MTSTNGQHDDLTWGSVVFVSGEHKGRLGYYDDDEDDDKAIVYLGAPLLYEYVVVPRSHIRNVTTLEHEQFKRDLPEFCELMGLN